MILGCDAHCVLFCVSGLRVSTCTSLMNSGGRRGAITYFLITSGLQCLLQETGQQNLFRLSCFPGSHPEYAGLYSVVGL